jgi:hypothetical protein
MKVLILYARKRELEKKFFQHSRKVVSSKASPAHASKGTLEGII